MKPSELLFRLKKIGKDFSFDLRTQTRNGNDYHILNNANNARSILHELRSLQIFDIPDILNQISSTIGNTIEFDRLNDKNVIAALENVILQIRIAISIFEKTTNITEEPFLVYLKLPQVNSFDEIITSLDNLNKILSQTILYPEIDGKVEFSGVESGSSFVKIIVGTAKALGFIAALSWSATVIFKKVQEAKYLETLAKSQIDQNQHRVQAMEEYHKIMREMIIEIEAKHIYLEHFNEEIENEKFQRIKFCLDLLSKEIARGAEIQPSLTAPEEVSNLFPDMKRIPTIESKVKRIEDIK